MKKTTDIIDSNNRCEGIKCSSNSQCSTGYCGGEVCTIEPEPEEKSKTLVIVLSILGSLLLLGVIGGGYWYYRKRERDRLYVLEQRQTLVSGDD